MNYDHLNKIQSYWIKEIFPNLVHTFNVTSFDDYLKKFSFLPSGKWIHDFEKVKLGRLIFAVDPKKFSKKYKECCVSYNSPLRPEDGFQRAIYQFSPTLHCEAAFWVWIEQEKIQSYASLLICYNDETEYLKFLDDLYKIKRDGNTEERLGVSNLVQNAQQSFPDFLSGKE
jgi:hypothetical protein